MDALIAWKPFHYDFNIASARVRAFIPCQYMQEAGWSCEIYNSKHQERYNLVVFQKAYEAKDLILAEQLKSRGTKIVLDLCDNHFYNPYNIPEYTEKSQRLARMLELADLVTVATPELGKLIAKESTNLNNEKEIIVIDDIIYWFPTNFRSRMEAKIARWKERNRDELRVIWFGNSKLAKVYVREGIKDPPSGLTSIRKVLPALEKLHQDIPVKLTVISNARKQFNREMKNVSFPTIYHEWDMASLSLIFEEQDTCIIPFDFNDFTICKTNNRLATSLQQGLPVIADPIPSYQEFSDYVLFADWENSLRTYATNKALRNQHARQGRNYVRKTYNKKRAIKQWSALFTKVLGQKI